MSTIASQNFQLRLSGFLAFMHKVYSGNNSQPIDMLPKFKMNSIRIIERTILVVTWMDLSSDHHTSKLMTLLVVLNLMKHTKFKVPF